MIEEQAVEQMIEEEMIFSPEVSDQREKVEQECNVLQTLIDWEMVNTSTSFLWMFQQKKHHYH
jgi:hypothetical protein